MSANNEREFTVEAWVVLDVSGTDLSREAIASLLNRRFQYHSANFTVDAESKTVTARVQTTVMIDLNAMSKDIPYEQALYPLAVEALKKSTDFTSEESVDQLDVF